MFLKIDYDIMIDNLTYDVERYAAVVNDLSMMYPSEPWRAEEIQVELDRCLADLAFYEKERNLP